VAHGHRSSPKEAMNITDTIAGRYLQALRAVPAGQVFVPGQAGYDQARQGRNLAVDTRPAVIVGHSRAPSSPGR
jgi:hypothetical protein